MTEGNQLQNYIHCYQLKGLDPSYAQALPHEIKDRLNAGGHPSINPLYCVRHITFKNVRKDNTVHVEVLLAPKAWYESDRVDCDIRRFYKLSRHIRLNNETLISHVLFEELQLQMPIPINRPVIDAETEHRMWIAGVNDAVYDAVTGHLRFYRCRTMHGMFQFLGQTCMQTDAGFHYVRSAILSRVNKWKQSESDANYEFITRLLVVLIKEHGDLRTHVQVPDYDNNFWKTELKEELSKLSDGVETFELFLKNLYHADSHMLHAIKFMLYGHIKLESYCPYPSLK